MRSPESQNGHEHRRGSTWRDRQLERRAVRELAGWECGSWGEESGWEITGTSGGAVRVCGLQLLCPRNPPGKNAGGGCLSLLQGSSRPGDRAHVP